MGAGGGAFSGGDDGARAGALRAMGAVIAMSVALVATPDLAASQQMMMQRGDGAVVVLPSGRMAVLGLEADQVVVRGVVEGTGSATETAPVMEGDRIVSIQGASVSALDAFTTAYDAIAEGEEVVLGVLRGNASQTVRFPRPPHAAPLQHMVVTSPSGGAGAWSTASPAGGGATEVVIAGAHIRNNEQGMPAVVFRGSDPAADLVSLRVGDVIVSVNGQTIAALAGLELLYGRVAVGGEVALGIQRGGSEEVVRFAKPAGR